MHDSRLVLLLRSLNKKEFRRLGKFLKSPFFNNNERVVSLYEFLRKHHPTFDAPSLAKKQVDKKIFQEKDKTYTYQARRIRDCMSNLSLLVIEFIAVLEGQDEVSLTKDQLILKAFSKRNLYKLFEDKTEQVVAKLMANPVIDFHYYKTIFELREGLFFHSDNPKLEHSSDQVNAVMRNLDLFYILTKLRISCELKAREQILAETYNIDLINEVIEMAKEKYSSHSSLFIIYPHLIKLFSEGYNDALYQETKTIYFNQLENIGKSEQKVILHYFINIMSSGLSKGMNRMKEVFELYKAGLQHEILILNNRITPESFSNIAVSGSISGAFQWTWDFIINFEKYLDEDIRTDTKLMSLAYWYFNKKQYDETINLINEHQLPSKMFYIRTRALLIRTYLEKLLEDKSFYQVLISNTDAFRKQVDRNTLLSKDKKMSYKNLIKFINKIAALLQTQPPKLQDKLNKLKVDIQTKDTVIARAWLLSKIEQFEKKG